MATTVPKKVVDRFSSKLKKFQPILRYALDRDVNESDTVDITTDILGELFGYEKFVEVTSEYKIRGTHCDLAIEINGQVRILIEVKAVGIELNERHLRQAVNYAANKGVDWVVLTNGAIWRVYLVEFTKPIKAELVMEIDLLKLSTRKTEDFGPLFLLSREGIGKSALPDFYAQKQATSRFILGALFQSDPLLKAARRELKKLSTIRVDIEQIRAVVEHEVLKREVVEGAEATAARKIVEKALAGAAKEKKKSVVTQPKKEVPKKDDKPVNGDWDIPTE